MTESPKQAMTFEDFKKEVLNDYKIATTSRECSLLGRREVLTGKAKFGIFGDGKEVPQLALAKAFKNGDFRSGYYPVQPPCGIGVEAAGTIEAVGAGVTSVAVGDRVSYNGGPLGAYATERVMPAAPLFKLPEGIGFETAAASTMRASGSAPVHRSSCWRRAIARGQRLLSPQPGCI